eukprot:6140409-Pleurochrysis_carterae.AAC.1
MSRSEDPYTADTLFKWPLSSFPTRLDRLALVALGLGDPRTLARKPEYASSFTSSGRASRRGGSSNAPAMSRSEDPCTADTPF